MEERIHVLKNKLLELVASPTVQIAKIMAESHPSSCVLGVYLISAPKKPDEIVYAGRTKSKTIHGRLCDHCRLKTGSDLSGILLRFSDYPQIAKEYEARWIHVENEIERAQLELFTISVLCPPFNRYA